MVPEEKKHPHCQNHTGLPPERVPGTAPSMRSDHNGITLEINNRNIIGKSTKTWKLNGFKSSLRQREVSRETTKMILMDQP